MSAKTILHTVLIHAVLFSFVGLWCCSHGQYENVQNSSQNLPWKTIGLLNYNKTARSIKELESFAFINKNGEKVVIYIWAKMISVAFVFIVGIIAKCIEYLWKKLQRQINDPTAIVDLNSNNIERGLLSA